MKITATTWEGRPGWCLDNGNLRLHVLRGGGHIASLERRDVAGLNPLWRPHWTPREPWQYRTTDAAAYESKLLAAITGHNVCLGWFGAASEAEEAQGLGPHGEAPTARWRRREQKVGARSLRFTYGCELPAAMMSLERRLVTSEGSDVVHVTETVRNRAARDLPFTMCQHVTFGAPFLEKGETVFDMPAVKGHTYPATFGERPRLAMDESFTWPDGPGVRGGTVDLRRIARRHRVSGDYSVQQIDPGRELAWFSALHPGHRLLVAYAWQREDYPWVGNWEENGGRTASPWDGCELTRGMEFTNTPFPTSLQDAAARGRFQGLPTVRWLPARGRLTIHYAIIVKRVDPGVSGVCDVRARGRKFELDLVC